MIRFVLGAWGIVFAASLPWAVVDAVIGARRRRREPIGVPARRGWMPGALRWVVVAASLLAVATLAVLLQMPFLLYGGMPLPTRTLSTQQQVATLLPYAVAALTVVSIAGVVIVWRSEVGRRATRIGLGVVAAALIVYCALVVF